MSRKKSLFSKSFQSSVDTPFIAEGRIKNFLQQNGDSPTAEFYLPTAVTAPDVLVQGLYALPIPANF